MTDEIDNQTALRLKKRLAEEFRDQLTIGVPTNEDEAGLRRLAAQITSQESSSSSCSSATPCTPSCILLLDRTRSIRSSATWAAATSPSPASAKQGELNVDVLDHDACEKLAKWFEDRWNDRWCIDISDELVEIIEESWARERADPALPHLRQDGLPPLAGGPRRPVGVPHPARISADKLFDFQKAAVKIAAHHLNKRGGVLIGDVVGWARR